MSTQRKYGWKKDKEDPRDHLHNEYMTNPSLVSDLWTLRQVIDNDPTPE